jgi:non-specific protein-tyrosine kinase
MDLERYGEILDRRKWTLIITAITTLTVVALGTYWTTPIYEASALVRIAEQAVDDRYVNVNYSERVMQTYVHLLTSRPFLEQVIAELSLQTGVATLARTITVEPLANTELIEIRVENANPQQATEIANILASLLVSEGQKLYVGSGKTARQILEEQLAVQEAQLSADRAELAALVSAPSESGGESNDVKAQDLSSKIRVEEQTYASLLSQYEQARLSESMRANSVNVVETAIVPSRPTKPRVPVNLALGLLAGLMGGIALIVAMEVLDPAIHSADDLERKTDLPMLGRVPVFDDAMASARGEALRVLSMNTLSLANNSNMKTLLITSPEPGVGKSTIMVFLAMAMAQSGRRVIAVDADLRNPKLHTLLGLKRDHGLSDVLADPTQLATALKETRIRGLRALTAGAANSNAALLLFLPTLSEIVRSIAEQADVVLWDSPPILATADGSVLGPLMDGVVLVTARDQTTLRRFETSVKQLRQVGSSLLGIIYNKAKASNTDYMHYYHRSSSGRKPGVSAH